MSHIIFGSLAITIFCLALLASNEHAEEHILVLIVWHVLLIINFGAIFLISVERVYGVGAVFALSTAAGFFHGPVMLYYLHVITGIDQWQPEGIVVHALPGAAILIAQIFLPWFSGSTSEIFYHISALAGMISVMAYLISICFKIRRVSKASSQVLSQRSYTRLSWLRNACIAVLICAIVFFVSQAFFQLTSVKLPHYGNFYANLFLCLAIVYVQFRGIPKALSLPFWKLKC